jgi:hypothetical protein
VNGLQPTRDCLPVKKTKTWPSDYLKYHVEFPFHATFYPYGFPVEISTNSKDVIAAAEQSWGLFPNLDPSAGKVHFRVGVAENGSEELPPPPSHRAQRSLISVISDSENFAVCDVKARFAFCWVTPATVADSGFFRYHFLDIMGILLVLPPHFAIIHAACVALDGHGVLLCGDAEAGKSTLSFACAQRGWTFVSDDGCFALRKNPGRVVIGNPLSIRLREDASRFFPQLRDRSVVLRQTGDFRYEIPTSTLPGFSTAFQCVIDHVVFLNRHVGGSAQLSTFPKDQAQCRLEATLTDIPACTSSSVSNENQPELFLADPEALEERRVALRTLLGGSIHELCYSSLDSGIECLESLVRSRN